MVLQFNNTNPMVKFKVDETEEGYYCAVMPLHPDGSTSYIAYEGLSFYEAWHRFTEVIGNDRVIVPKQFEQYLG